MARRWIGVALLFVGMIIMSGLAHAQAASVAVTSKYSMELAEGGSQTAELYIKNTNLTEEVALRIDLIDFTYKDTSGVPTFIDQANTVPTRWSLKPFVSMETAVTIKAGQTMRFPIKVTIPAHTLPGSYYGAIRYHATTAAPNGVGIVAANTTLVFLNVRGVARQAASLPEVGLREVADSQNQQWFWRGGPRYVAYEIKNSGNTVIEPGGSVVISSLTGGKDVVLPVLNSQNERALISQTRDFTVCIDAAKPTNRCAGALAPGVYRVKFYVAYAFPGSETRDFRRSFLIWVLPWWLILSLLVLLVLLVLTISKLYMFLKKRQKPKSKRVQRFEV